MPCCAELEGRFTEAMPGAEAAGGAQAEVGEAAQQNKAGGGGVGAPSAANLPGDLPRDLLLEGEGTVWADSAWDDAPWLTLPELPPDSE